MIIREACVENFENIPNVIKNGVHRIELCDNLTVGGTTVSKGTMIESKKYCQLRNIPIMCIIRPRGGDFIYSQEEQNIMIEDIRTAKNIGIDGIVIGCLNKDNWIDEKLMETLLREAKGMLLTFHMAFDVIDKSKKNKAIDWIISHRFDRILTHGGLGSKTINENLEEIKNTILYSNNRIIIIPGGGITFDNVEQIHSVLQVKEYHGTKIVKF